MRRPTLPSSRCKSAQRAVVSCGDVATQATPPRAPSITGPAGHHAHCRGGRPRAPRGRAHPGVAAVAGLRRQLQPVARGPGCRGRRPVRRDRVPGAEARRQPAGTDPPIDRDGARQRRAADSRPGGAHGPRSRLVAVRIAGRRARDRLHRPGPIRGRAARRDRRVPRDATHPDRGCTGHGVTFRPVQHESRLGADRGPGDEPNCRGRGAAHAFGQPLPVGAKDARCHGRTRQAPEVGLGDRRRAVAGGPGRDPGRPDGHVADPGGEPLPPPAHGPPESHRRCPRRRAHRPPCRPSAPRRRSA